MFDVLNEDERNGKSNGRDPGFVIMILIKVCVCVVACPVLNSRDFTKDWPVVVPTFDYL